MQIYRHKTTISTAGGTGSTNTNPVIGGLCRQLYILAGTTTTAFRASITDEDDVVVRSYAWHRGELNDSAEFHPLVVKGVYTIQITNASADGEFTTLMMVQE